MSDKRPPDELRHPSKLQAHDLAQLADVGDITAASDDEEHDLASQSLVSHHVHWRDGFATSTSLPCRYVWPTELDLMAQLAGMHLHERRAGWQGETFTSQSDAHVSVWQRD